MLWQDPLGMHPIGLPMGVQAIAKKCREMSGRKSMHSEAISTRSVAQTKGVEMLLHKEPPTSSTVHQTALLKNEKSAQRESFWDGHPADIRGSFARMFRSKTSPNRSGRSKSMKNKHFGTDIHGPKARTSMTLWDFQKLRAEKLWAESSFPNCRQSKIMFQLWGKKKPINIKNCGGTHPSVCPVCPMDMSHLSRLSRGHSGP